MMFAVEYRTRGSSGWKVAQEFESAEEAERIRKDAIKYQMKSTTDWRVRPVEREVEA